MTHFSLKNAAIAASVLTLSLSASIFAAPVATECIKDPAFAANTCDECYTDTHTPTKTTTGWTSELSTAKIPWKHSGIELSELITESAQKLPEIIASTDVIVTPAETADKIWEFDTDILWYPIDQDKEFFIDKGTQVNLYTLKTGVKLSMSGKGTKDSVLVKTAMVYEKYDKELYQSDNGNNRNICVLHTFYNGTTTTPPTTTPPTEQEVVPPPTTVEKVDPLNAAGPASTEEEETTPEITPEQTKTQAGPGMWIFLLLAFAFSGAWTAWKKQKA